MTTAGSADTDRGQQLYAAARDLFIESGYRDVDVAAITDRCGVSHGTFYNYYTSKRAVLQAVIDNTQAEVLAAVVGEQDVSTLSGRDEYLAEFTDMVRRTVAHISTRVDVTSFVVLSAPGVDDDAYATSLRGFDEIARAVTRFLAHGASRGWIRGDIELSTAGGAVASSVVLAVLPLLLGEVADLDTDAVTRVVTTYLFGGMRSAPEVP